jgi:hypothetical protein
MWPTPRATDGTHGGRVTPRKSREGGNLIEAVSAATWPTPTARDAGRGAGWDEPGRPLSERIGGPLNPAWVEALMGFPIGWTDLAHLGSSDSNASSAQPHNGFPASPDWATPSFRKSPNTSGGSSSPTTPHQRASNRMSFNIVAAGTIEQVMSQIRHAVNYGDQDSDQLETVREYLLSQLDTWPPNPRRGYEPAALVEVRGHTDRFGPHLTLKVRPLSLPAPGSDQPPAEHGERSDDAQQGEQA